MTKFLFNRIHCLWQAVLFLAVTKTSTNHNECIGVHALVTFRTERVTTIERVLDVHIFRRWSISVDQYMSKNPIASRKEAWETLTERLRVDDPSVQFVAVIDDADDEDVRNDDTRFAETHGIVGAVDVTSTSDTNVYLKNLMVDDRVRRRGIASALIRDVIEYASPKTVVLTTEDQHSLYAFHGFQLQEDGMTMVLEQQ